MKMGYYAPLAALTIKSAACGDINDTAADSADRTRGKARQRSAQVADNQATMGYAHPRSATNDVPLHRILRELLVNENSK